jgi:hypothetical protein
MYYNPQLGVSTSNVCAYGNHGFCDVKDCGCSCHPIEKPPEETTEEHTPYYDPEPTRL